MIVSDKRKIGEVKRGAFPNINCLYSMIPREMRMHMYRVSYYAQMLTEAAWKSGMFPAEYEEAILTDTKDMFRLHDIGRYYIPTDIYNKVENLTNEEVEEIKRHTVYAEKAMKSLFFHPFPETLMPYFLEIAVYHHERWDGTGYPKQKKELEIPFLARICAIADTYDGMVSWKPYRKSLERKQALQLIEKEVGKQFQPELVPLFLACEKEIELIDLQNGNVG